MSGEWSRNQACSRFGVCDGRSGSDLVGEKISKGTNGFLSPRVGKEFFHVGLLGGGVWVVGKVLEALAKGNQERKVQGT
jgi:hypothetical protein